MLYDCCDYVIFFFFKQKTAYEMRISDWSSDVCSSDLSLKNNSFKIDIRSSANGLILKQLWDNKEIAFTPRSETFFLNEDGTFPLTFLLSDGEATQEIGSASCRERVCQYV